MNLQKVKKRDGSIQDFDVLKVKKVIAWATNGIDVEPLELEQSITGIFKEVENSRDIQNKLIIAASQLVDIKSERSYGWNKVAGRLKLMDLYKTSAKVRKHNFLDYNPNFDEFVFDMVEAGIYDKKLTRYYNSNELSIAGTFIKQEYDMEYSISAIVSLIGKTLTKYLGETVELIQERNLICALMLNIFEDSHTRLQRVKETYEALAKRQISLATPMYAGLGIAKASLASCFIQQPEDSLDGIQYNEAVYGRISKNGGASGYPLSKIRAIGSPVKGYKNASGGVIPWVKILNDKCVAVNQTGRRQGAITPALPIWHRDIFDFLEIQLEAGDVRNKCYDVSPQVVMPDLFMKYAEADKDWYTFCPYELKKVMNVELDEVFNEDFENAYNKAIELYKVGKIQNVAVFRAKDLLKKIYIMWHATGFPTITFSDTINNSNPNKHIGSIPCANLCQESFGVVKPSTDFRWELNKETGEAVFKHNVGLTHICNLMSINIYNSQNDLDTIVPLITRMLDNTIDITGYTSPEAQKYNINLRVIGIGIIGFADYLVSKDIPYNNVSKMKTEIDNVFSKISGLAYKTSAEIAKEKGAYPYYKNSEFSKGIFLNRHIDDIIQEQKDLGNLDNVVIWQSLKNLNEQYGIRNGSIMAIAPTTSTSINQEVSAGVTPVFKKAYKDKNSVTTSTIIAPEIKNGKTFYYLEQKNLNQAMLYSIVGYMQRWVDQGISFELNWDQNLEISVKDYHNVMMTAWKNKCKTIYYHRHITVNAEDAIRDSQCVGCAG